MRIYWRPICLPLPKQFVWPKKLPSPLSSGVLCLISCVKVPALTLPCVCLCPAGLLLLTFSCRFSHLLPIVGLLASLQVSYQPNSCFTSAFALEKLRCTLVTFSPPTFCSWIPCTCAAHWWPVAGPATSPQAHSPPSACRPFCTCIPVIALSSHRPAHWLPVAHYFFCCRPTRGSCVAFCPVTLLPHRRP